MSAKPTDATGIDAATKEKIIAADLANIVKKVKSGRPLSNAERTIIQQLNSPETKPDGVKNLSQLAALLGISRQALNHLKKKKDSPNPADIPAWKIYIAAQGREGTAPPDIKRRIAEKKLSILTTEDQREKTKLKRLEETLIPREAGQRAATRFAAGLVHRLLPIPLRVSQRFALETDSAQIQEALTKEIHQAITGTEDFKYGLLPCPKCSHPILT